jgi:hypothetical protein
MRKSNNDKDRTFFSLGTLIFFLSLFLSAKLKRGTREINTFQDYFWKMSFVKLVLATLYPNQFEKVAEFLKEVLSSSFKHNSTLCSL